MFERGRYARENKTIIEVRAVWFFGVPKMTEYGNGKNLFDISIKNGKNKGKKTIHMEGVQKV